MNSISHAETAQANEAGNGIGCSYGRRKLPTSCVSTQREESAILLVWLIPIVLRYKRAGLIFLIPIVDRMVRMDLRVVTIDVARQEVMTRHNVPMTVDAVIYFRVIDAAAAVVRVEKYLKATSLISQTTLRSVLGQAELDELLSQRDKINLRLQEIIDRQTDPWGVKVTAVEVKSFESQTLKEP